MNESNDRIRKALKTRAKFVRVEDSPQTRVYLSRLRTKKKIAVAQVKYKGAAYALFLDRIIKNGTS